MKLVVAQTPDDKPEWEDAGEDSMDLQDVKYDVDGSSEESMEKDARTIYYGIMGHRDP